MRQIKDLTMECVEKEMAELQNAPMTGQNVEMYAALLAIRRAMVREGYRIEHREEHMEHERAMTLEDARAWVRKMENWDGTKGEHWTIDQVKTLQAEYGPTLQLPEFYAVVNSIYSDFGGVFKTFGIEPSNTKFYACMAKAWLRDKDAVDGKATAYFDHIVK